MNGETSASIRILFVDDSKVMLKTASKILGVEFDVVTAIDGDDAWAKLEKDHEIQVLFTDINMPGTDGYGLLHKVRTAEHLGLHDMPVIMVTGAEDDESAARQQALDRGATDFLSKRLLGTELLTRARAHAKYQRVNRQLQAQTTLDPLTGLSNESGFMHRLEQDIAYARRHGNGLALLRVEIDGLPAMLEARGNEAVEQIVVHVSKLMRKRIREEDTAAHIGLGGFAVALPGGQLEGIEVMAAWLQAQAAAHAPPIALRTAVVSTGQEIFSDAQGALDRCRTILERKRQQVPKAPVLVEVPRPVAPVPPRPVATPEPVNAKAAPAPVMPRREPVQARRTRPVPTPPPRAPNRVIAFLKAFGARARAWMARLLRRR